MLLYCVPKNCTNTTWSGDLLLLLLTPTSMFCISWLSCHIVAVLIAQWEKRSTLHEKSVRRMVESLVYPMWSGHQRICTSVRPSLLLHVWLRHCRVNPTFLKNYHSTSSCSPLEKGLLSVVVVGTGISAGTSLHSSNKPPVSPIQIRSCHSAEFQTCLYPQCLPRMSTGFICPGRSGKSITPEVMLSRV